MKQKIDAATLQKAIDCIAATTGVYPNKIAIGSNTHITEEDLNTLNLAITAKDWIEGRVIKQ